MVEFLGPGHVGGYEGEKEEEEEGGWQHLLLGWGACTRVDSLLPET